METRRKDNIRERNNNIQIAPRNR